MSAATRQLSASSATLRANGYYTFSEAAPELARGHLSGAPRAAFPDLNGEPDQDAAAAAGSDVRASEIVTLKGKITLCAAHDPPQEKFQQSLSFGSAQFGPQGV